MFERIEFRLSVAEPEGLPPEGQREIAFAGRSNAGKSSAINTICRRKQLAFVSKQPGRTQLINYFSLGEGLFLVDLPGYGYAKVPGEIRRQWGRLLPGFLRTRASLVGLVVIMDIRHPMTDLDRQLLDWVAPSGVPVHILLSKTDKLARSRAVEALHKVRALLREDYPQASVQLFSSLTRMGLEEAQQRIWSLLVPAVQPLIEAAELPAGQ